MAERFHHKEVHAGRVGNVRYGRVQLWRQGGTALQQGLRMALHTLGTQLGAGQLKPVLHHLHITHGAMPGGAAQAMALHDGIQTMALELRVQQA